MSPPSVPAVAHARRHLVAGLAAVAVVIAVAVGGSCWGTALERKSFVALLPLFAESKEEVSSSSSVGYIEHLKNQGTALQRRAFERPDILPLYGSSELTKRIPDKSSLFYLSAPTGFSVLPVGKVGTTSLIILQKLASLGGATEGKRVAISVSPTWFFTEAPAEHPYHGNFSRQQAFAALLNDRLSFGFRRDLARRMALHPVTLEQDALLHFLNARFARGGRADHLLYHAAWPLAQMMNALHIAQDHFETALYLTIHPAKPGQEIAKAATSLDWDQLVADVSAKGNPNGASAAYRPYFRKFGTDIDFREKVANAPQWDDFELLLQGLHEMGMLSLILCMPPDGVYLENGGISKESLDLFTTRIRDLSARYGAQVETFDDHEEDPAFFADPHDHMSAKGWMYYNRALDEFYHTPPAELERAFAKGHHKRARTASGNLPPRRWRTGQVAAGAFGRAFPLNLPLPAA